MTDELLAAAQTSDPTEVAGQRRQRQQRRLWLWGLGLGCVGLTALAVPLFASRTVAEQPELEAVALMVETERLEPVTSYAVLRAYTGEIRATRSSDLGFSRGGELIALMVAEGEVVEANQAIASLDSEILAAQRQQLLAQRAEASARLQELETGARPEDIAAAQAQVRDLESQLSLQAQSRSRREALYAEGAISREQLDEVAFGTAALEARRDQAQSQLDELLNGTRPEQIAAQAAAISQIDARLAQLDIEISKSTLRAPFAGRIAQQFIFEGTVVNTGQPVVRLIENRPPEARIGLPQAIATRLQNGEAVTVTVADRPFAATVQAVLPEVEPQTRTQQVVFELEADAPITPGQTARVALSETVETTGFWLPTQALSQDIRGLWRVYHAVPTEDGHVIEARAVEILHQESERVLVRGTLQAGDQVITSGVHRLIPGQSVRLDQFDAPVSQLN